MAHYGAQNYTSFQAVNLKGSVALRIGHNDPYQGTLAINGGSLDGNRQWLFPNKNGVFPISGTVAVALPSALANNVWYDTTVTVAGITVEDGITANVFEQPGSVYTYGTQGTKYIYLGAKATAGGINFSFYNLGNGTGHIILTAAYTAVR